MASVNLIESPDPQALHPVENCIRFCVEYQDLYSVGAQPASARIFLINGTTYAAGLDFVFAGTEFTTGTDLGQVDLSDPDKEIQTTNFINAILNHPDFLGQVTQITTVGIATNQIDFTWSEVGQRDNHVFDFSAFVPNAIEGPSGTGFDADYVPGFEMVYQVLCVGDSGAQQVVMKLQNTPYIIDEETGEPLQDCIEVQHALSGAVRTTIPACDTGMAEDLTIWKDIMIYYGHIQSKDPCGVEKFPLQQVPTFRVWNGAYNLKDGEDPSLYFATGFGSGEWDILTKFLRTGPLSRDICRNTCDWLWLHLNGRTHEETISAYNVLYTFYDSSGATISSENIVIAPENRTIIIPSGTKNINNLPPTTAINWNNVYRYTIEVRSVAPAARYSEMVEYRVCGGCCPKYSIYFLDTPGGYNRIDFDKVEAIEFTDTYQEVCKETKCSGTFQDQLMGGNQRFASESRERIILQSTTFKKSDEVLCMLKAFKASDSKFIVFTDKQGETNPKRVVVEPGSTRIFQQEGILKVTVTVIEAQEYLKPSEQ